MLELAGKATFEKFFKEVYSMFLNMIEENREEEFQWYFFDWVLKFGYIIEGYVKDILFTELRLDCLLNKRDFNKIAKKNKLNETFGTSYSEVDIWEKKTTINNQFIYFRNHLSLFSDIFEVDQSQTLLLKNESETKLVMLLLRDNQIESIDISNNERYTLYLEEITQFD